MENKNKQKPKLSYKNINRTFGIVVFVLVFLFTFFFSFYKGDLELIIIGSVFGGTIALTLIAWLVTILVFRHKLEANDPNKQKVKQALDKIEQERKEESKKKNGEH